MSVLAGGEASGLRLSDWLEAFRDRHERARRGLLPPAEAAAYREAREELARALLVAQRLTLKAGDTPRRTLRVARALQVELDLPEARARAVTVDLSVGGFSTLLAKAPAIGEEVGVSIRMPAAGPIACRARVTDAVAAGNQARVSALFLDLPEGERERLELFVFDTVLAHLVP